MAGCVVQRLRALRIEPSMRNCCRPYVNVGFHVFNQGVIYVPQLAPTHCAGTNAWVYRLNMVLCLVLRLTTQHVCVSGVDGVCVWCVYGVGDHAA